MMKLEASKVILSAKPLFSLLKAKPLAGKSITIKSPTLIKARVKDEDVEFQVETINPDRQKISIRFDEEGFIHSILNTIYSKNKEIYFRAYLSEEVIEEVLQTSYTEEAVTAILTVFHSLFCPDSEIITDDGLESEAMKYLNQLRTGIQIYGDTVTSIIAGLSELGKLL